MDGILTDPQSHLDVIARERAVCCLFYGIHSWSSKNPIQKFDFTISTITLNIINV